MAAQMERENQTRRPGGEEFGGCWSDRPGIAFTLSFKRKTDAPNERNCESSTDITIPPTTLFRQRHGESADSTEQRISGCSRGADE
jgi:hypothetical protein